MQNAPIAIFLADNDPELVTEVFETPAGGYLVSFNDTGAREVIGTRMFPDATPDRALDYAERVVNGRVPAGESNIVRVGPVEFVLAS